MSDMKMKADKKKHTKSDTKPPICPVEKEFQMRIDSDGQWFHEGGLIKRLALVKLFSSVLSCDEDGQHWLRTPVEFGKIEVEDAAFVITQMQITGTGTDSHIQMIDNIGQEHILSEDTPLIFRKAPIPPYALQPYIQLHKGLFAKLSRPVYYQLASLATEHSDSGKGDTAKAKESHFGIWSAGRYFAFPVDETGM